MTEGTLAFAEVVLSNRPWRDERVVSGALRAWADRYSGVGSLSPGLADGAGQVAEHLRLLGLLADPPSDGDMIGITFAMIQNVARGRGPTDYDELGDHVIGLPKRTLRRYRQRAREAGGNPGSDPLFAYLRSFQYGVDVTALVNGGRSPAAARRWLERHPGLHARDAPPARPRH